MSRGDPVEFTRRLATGNLKRCGNEVSIGSQLGDALVHEPVANTAAQITMAAPGANQANVIGTIYWSLSANPAANVRLHITDGGVLVHVQQITVGGPGFIKWNPPRRFGTNNAVLVFMAAAGAGVFGTMAIHGWTEAV
jgi:hypothetical protein